MELILAIALLLVVLAVVLGFIGYSAWPRERSSPQLEKAKEQETASAKTGT